MPNELKPIERLKNVINVQSVQEQFQNALGERKNLFIASLIDLFGSDETLQKCNPADVIKEALKAATLNLPINKSLGFAYVIAYKDIPQLQIGYKGIIQLAQRTGLYKFINAGEVYEGELRYQNKLTGEIDLNGEAKSDRVIGYFAYFETIGGFKKASYWSMDKIFKHAVKYSASLKSAMAAISNYAPNEPLNTPAEIQAAYEKATANYWTAKKTGKAKTYVPKSVIWVENFDSMACKTVLKNLITKYGPMSIELADMLDKDNSEDVYQNANATPFDFPMTDGEPLREPANTLEELTEPAQNEEQEETPEWAAGL